jgi:RNA polymerase sigma-70 factor (ECF subfamily)
VGQNQTLKEAYEDLLCRYLPALRRLVWSYTRYAQEREDLMQEIALGLWTALPRFRGDASERTWLYRIAHNTALSFIASSSRRTQNEQPGEPPDTPAAGVDPECGAIARQHRERLRAAVEALPFHDRQIMILHLEGLSAGEIQEVTGLTAGSIAVRLTRVRQKLAARLQGVQP